MLDNSYWVFKGNPTDKGWGSKPLIKAKIETAQLRTAVRQGDRHRR